MFDMKNEILVTPIGPLGICWFAATSDRAEARRAPFAVRPAGHETRRFFRFR